MKTLKNILAWFSPFNGPQVYDNRKRGPVVTMATALLALAVVVLAVLGLVNYMR